VSDSSTKKARLLDDQNISLTQTIRRLTVSDSTVTDLDAHLEERHRALLVCRDADMKKWGRRWLASEGIDVEIADDPATYLECARAAKPDVIVLEGALRMPAGESLIQAFADAADIEAPVIVLSSTTRDLGLALEVGVFDVIRKPYEWRLVSNRAKIAARFTDMQHKLSSARSSLTEALDLAEVTRRQLRSRESFEPITGLPNKKKFVDLLKRGMHAVDRDQNVMAVFVVGFNRFRLVIEAMGQDSADMVLTEIGKKLGTCLQDVGMLQANTNGLRTSAAASIDQARFALMLTCSGDQDGLAALQQQLVEQLSRPVHIAGQTVYLSASVGVALYPQDASDVDSLLQRADNAMRDAQSRGGGFKFYCTETDAAAARKLKLEHMLHEAMNDAKLSLAYQPIVSAATGNISGAEALLRWKQDDGTFISPAEFIPIAEESGLMNRVGEFVLDRACLQMRQWLDEGIKLPYVCVNVSKAQLMQGGFAQTVRRVLEVHGIQPAQLELELSERGVLSGDFDVISQLHEIKEQGVSLSVDDFGTGDSAIAYLKELPVDVLKIDRSYISGLTENRKDAAIIAAMIALGHSLDLKIVAEGVETREQFEALRRLGCDDIQGFYISRPVSEPLFASFLKKSSLKSANRS
jgi:predicted signal transduction protein with EAL and GGDEF domain